MEAADYVADVLDSVLYGASARAEGAKGARGSAVARGVGWAVGLAILAAAVYALISTGSLKDAWHKLGRTASEVSGGLFGKRNK